jgi:hypothetical protein
MGGSWGPDSTIVFASRGTGLYKVSAAGGVPQPLAGSDLGTWPEILPDHKTVLFSTGNAIAIIPLSGGQRRILARTNDSPRKGPQSWGLDTFSNLDLDYLVTWYMASRPASYGRYRLTLNR